MQGYILNINRVKDEDLIVTIITKSGIKTLYRFYGTRHSKIQLGFKLDFEINSNNMLINTQHIIKDRWIFDKHILYVWQQLCVLFSKHLFGLNEIDSFYYELLESISTKLHKQNPKRVLLEAYFELLEYEGRLNTEFLCASCNEKIEQEISFGRAFLPFHSKCIYSSGKSFDIKKIKEVFLNQSTILLDNEEIDKLYKILEMGL